MHHEPWKGYRGGTGLVPQKALDAFLHETLRRCIGQEQGLAARLAEQLLASAELQFTPLDVNCEIS